MKATGRLLLHLHRIARRQHQTYLSGTDTYGIEQYGVSATSAVRAAAAALSTNSEDIALVDARTDDKLKWLKEAIAAAAARTGAKSDMKICIDKHSSGRAWADVPAADKIMVGGLEAVYASLKDFVVWLNQKNQGTEDLEEQLAEADDFELLWRCVRLSVPKLLKFVREFTYMYM